MGYNHLVDTCRPWSLLKNTVYVYVERKEIDLVKVSFTDRSVVDVFYF